MDATFLGKAFRWLLVLAWSVASTALGQVVIQPAGVYVDPQGMLRARDRRANDKMANARKNRAGKKQEQDLCYISLPRLLREAEDAIKNGKGLSDDMRFLGGMVKLQYVFVYPKEKDLVIAGPAEPLDMSNPDRPLGTQTGRPALRLDDFVTVLRALGPEGKEKVIGCSLDPTEQGLAALRSVPSRLGSVAPGNYDRVARIASQAIGPQTVRVFGLPEARAAFTAIEADYVLKRLALGLMPSPVRGVKSHLSMLRPNESWYQRWWFTVFYEPLSVSADGLSYEIRGQSLRVKASDSPTDDESKASASSRQFIAGVNSNFVALTAAIPSWGDLCNVTDLGILAALIREDELHRKAQWNLTWILNPRGYPVPKVDLPKEAEGLANYKAAGNSLLISAGGVTLNYNSALQSRRSAGSELKSLAKTPPEETWVKGSQVAAASESSARSSSQRAKRDR